MAAPILAKKSTKNKIISIELFSRLKSYSGVFRFADHESEGRILKITDLIWSLQAPVGKKVL